MSYDYSRGNSVGTGTGKTGHLTKVIDNLNTDKNKEYEFDALGRLTKAKGGPTGNLWDQQYSYDRYGNRTNVQGNGNGIDGQPIPLDGIPNLAYDNNSNRITTTGFQYDSAGNQITGFTEDGTAIKLEYDAANRLQLVKKASDDSLMQAFQYGSTNARLIDYDSTAGLNKFYGSVGGTVLAEYTEFTSLVFTWTKSYTYLGDTQLATVTPNGTTGTSYEQAHLPFGKALASESSGSTNKRFTSYDRSAPTGLDYAINRTYDPKQGRFTQVDPIGMGAASLAAPQTLNMYSYCGNDPVNHTDPSGLFWGFFKKLFKWLMVALAVIVAVITIVGVVTAPFDGAGISKALDRAYEAAWTGIFTGVGAIANSFQTKDKKKKTKKPTPCDVLAKNIVFTDWAKGLWKATRSTTPWLENGGLFGHEDTVAGTNVTETYDRLRTHKSLPYFTGWMRDTKSRNSPRNVHWEYWVHTHPVGGTKPSGIGGDLSITNIAELPAVIIGDKGAFSIWGVNNKLICNGSIR